MYLYDYIMKKGGCQQIGARENADSLQKLLQIPKKESIIESETARRRDLYSRVYVEISNICNMSCSFCHGTAREPRRMSLGEFARVVGNLRGITEYLYLHVLGEPLTHPMLPTFIEYARACGFKVAITTNGTLLREKGDALILAGAYKVNISLHSFEGESEEKQNRYITDCIDFADKASEAGVLTVMRLWNLEDGNGAVDERNARTLELLHRRFSGAWTMGVRGARIREKLHLEYGQRFEWPDMEADDMGERVFCHGLGDHFGILADGRVVPCCLDAEGDMVLGNIFESDIRAILSSPRAVAIKEGFEKKLAAEELCRKCSYARRFKI